MISFQERDSIQKLVLARVRVCVDNQTLAAHALALSPGLKKLEDKATCALVLSSLCVDCKTLATSVT